MLSLGASGILGLRRKIRILKQSNELRKSQEQGVPIGGSLKKKLLSPIRLCVVF
jgi:hypothetical protein